ncbi:MAG: type II toxin-antitoxin system RelE/ParE family toxin [Actinomycetia bacterium]|nr:type II toxin-antitoxin system RelE/ParE family toxin [Actinomycetes bacterium]
MTWNLVVLPLAIQDIRQAASYYQDVAPAQVPRFLDSIQTTFDGLVDHPYAASPHPSGLRRRSVRVFPYSVWADVDEATRTVAIIGVVHHRRDPRIIDERAQAISVGDQGG